MKKLLINEKRIFRRRSSGGILVKEYDASPKADIGTPKEK